MRYFQHDSDASNNPDLIKLRTVWGLDWLARYWIILEMVAGQVKKSDLSFSLKTNDGTPFDFQELARLLKTNYNSLEKFLDFLADNHLIDQPTWKKKGVVYCPKLKDRAENYIKKFLKEPVGITSYDTTAFEYKAVKFFYDEVKKSYPQHMKQSFEQVVDEWVDIVEKLQRIDKHTPDEIRMVFKFVRQQDAFWGENIRSVSKFREKDKQDWYYFDVILMKCREAGKKADTKVVDAISIMSQQRTLDPLLETLNAVER